MDKRKQRLLSLDFFRGLTVAGMILVNNPGDWGHIYPPLEHSVWNGCTPTDLVYPFFLFIVGVAIVFAMETKKADPARHRQLIMRALRRAALIFALGIVLALIPKFDFANLRIPGVLQRIAVVYLICSVLYIRMSSGTLLSIFAFLLILYYLIMALVPVPGIGEASFEKGKNFAGWLDNIVFTGAHMWRQTKTWDPEGLLSTLPAIATGLYGVLTGSWLKRKDRMQAEKVAWMFCIGMLSVGVALIWDNFFPINKSIWTSSFVLYTGGFAISGLALCYWLIDVQGYQGFTKPFAAFGANAITVYVVSGILPELVNLIPVRSGSGSMPLLSYLYQTYFVPHFSPVNASLAWAIAYVVILLVPLWVMYNRKIFIRI